ncbi:LLM class flavin-dependent oxidoreductase [Actinokineospora auranticolor]|uniref:Luciferase family oxidoreductase group 1 n=1 Tax=Actinokineospora auranticolor TaxID=155976 RepID=A0A2S6GLQ8_9PSEU|nr:LLM class flavin-dependent oxidoreductase [Actinokineospora auranticolor]PPK66172.1 luciferase family oxidoreductase group 1 [Actinokineospora auranticolor]
MAGTGAVAPVSPHLSVLDVVPVWSDSDAVTSLRNAVALAEEVERLGYRRYWAAEHHNTPSLATSAPAVLAGRLAAATTDLRVGSGGVLLPHHSPLAVAEQFATLEALHPGRVDLGIGRAAGSDANTARALGGLLLHGPETFPDRLADLRTYLDTPARDASPRTIAALPSPPGVPWLCLLGASTTSAAAAAELGLPYAFAHQLAPHLAEAALATYHERFRPSPRQREPYAILSAMVIVGETDEHAREIAQPYLVRKLRIQAGDFYGLYPSRAEAAAHRFDGTERAWAEEHYERQLFGGPQRVAALVSDLLARTGAAELMGITLVPEHTERVASYARLARAVRPTRAAAHR